MKSAEDNLAAGSFCAFNSCLFWKSFFGVSKLERWNFSFENRAGCINIEFRLMASSLKATKARNFKVFFYKTNRHGGMTRFIEPLRLPLYSPRTFSSVNPLSGLALTDKKNFNDALRTHNSDRCDKTSGWKLTFQLDGRIQFDFNLNSRAFRTCTRFLSTVRKVEQANYPSRRAIEWKASNFYPSSSCERSRAIFVNFNNWNICSSLRLFEAFLIRSRRRTGSLTSSSACKIQHVNWRRAFSPLRNLLELWSVPLKVSTESRALLKVFTLEIMAAWGIQLSLVIDLAKPFTPVTLSLWL